MPATVKGVTLVATKLASGNVQLQWQNAAGGIVFVGVIPSADFTALNTTVNGGSTGAAISKGYSQDQNKGDYPQHFTQSEGN